MVPKISIKMLMEIKAIPNNSKINPWGVKINLIIPELLSANSPLELIKNCVTAQKTGENIATKISFVII